MPINPAVPGSPLRPHQQVYYTECGFQYQEGIISMPTVPACKCGMFSVGTCAECQAYVCGYHGRLVHGRFLCQDDAAAETAAADQQARERAQSATRATPPPSQTLADEVRAITDAAASGRRVQADAARSAEKRAAARAANLLPDVISLIGEVLAMPGAQSVSYDVHGEQRGHKWGAKQVADQARIGTHVGDRISGGANGWTPCSTYAGVWPAVAWLTGWSPPRGDLMGDPLVSSLWFNASGAVVAGSTPISFGRGSVYATPPLDIYCSAGAPGYTHHNAHPGPSANLFGPVNVNDLSIEHMVMICQQAIEGPILLRGSLARIVLGRKPETEYASVPGF